MILAIIILIVMALCFLGFKFLCKIKKDLFGDE